MMYQIYLFVKLGTISFFAMPALLLSHAIGVYFAKNIGKEDLRPFELTAQQAQYLNPDGIKRMIRVIAEAGRRELAEEVESALATAWIQDGSVDLSQRDNYFHCVRFVCSSTGKMIVKFVSIVEKQERGPMGQFNAIKASMGSLIDIAANSDILALIREHHENLVVEEDIQVVESTLFSVGTF